MIPPRQLCTCTLGGLWLGIDVLEVQEVLRWQPTTRVPLAPAAVRGLINLRGQIVTAVDMRRLFGLPASAPDAEPMNIVVRALETPVSLLVDAIGDVVEVSDAMAEPPPPTLAPAVRDLVRAVYKLPEHLLLELDTDRALRLELTSTLRTA